VTERRTFLRTSAAAFTAASYNQILGANERIRVAGLGVGGRCRYLLGHAVKHNIDLVALCDIYQPNLDRVRMELAPEARTYTDYRVLLDSKDFDAVFIGSPDHWHVPMTMAAIRAGKDVYVEKPISHTIEEGDALLKTAAGLKQIVQVGYQQRSWEHFREAKDIVASGRLGKVSVVLASWYQAFYKTAFPIELGGAGSPPEVNQEELNWNAFLGDARPQPFDPYRFKFWRWYWDFGGGHLTDLYSHYGDVIHWYMGVDTPRAVMSMGSRAVLPRFECPDTLTSIYNYAGELTVTYTGSLEGSLDGGNIVFRGTEAVLKINRDGFAIYPEGVIAMEKTQYPEPFLQARSLHDGTIDHIANFFACVKSRKQPNSPLETAVPMARAAHWGNQSYRTGKLVQN
jgi:predicted dehydrogenase